jgi:exodeoxyribonuclease VII small subunit
MSEEPSEIGFETAVQELERVVEELERGRPDLVSALAKYERGVKLLGQCQALLDGAERSVALLTGVDESGRPVTAEFDASATDTTTTAPAARKSRRGGLTGGAPDSNERD